MYSSVSRPDNLMFVLKNQRTQTSGIELAETRVRVTCMGPHFILRVTGIYAKYIKISFLYTQFVIVNLQILSSYIRNKYNTKNKMLNI